MNTLPSLSRFAVAAGSSLKPLAACVLVLVALAVVTGGCATHPPLHGAIVRKDHARAKALIERGRHLERRDSVGATPLHRAAEAGDTNLVLALLDRGVAIEATAHVDGEARQQGNALAGAFVADLGIHFLAAIAGGHAYTDVPYGQMIRDRRETKSLALRAIQAAALCRAKLEQLTEATLANR
ncbi:MAG: hypothetical protein KF833_11160 [Verrucomicrobiae bacterium]|nr:hypothetical protein [Verrucomicrobiae bacterium]